MKLLVVLLGTLLWGCRENGKEIPNQRGKAMPSKKNYQEESLLISRSVIKYRKIYSNIELSALSQPVRLSAEVCPPASISIKGSSHVVNTLTFVNGSSAKVYHTTDNTLVVKIIDEEKPFVSGSMWRETAASGILSNNSFFPKVYDNVEAACQMRMIVSDNVGNSTLFDLGNLMTVEIVQAIAVRVLEILETVHAVGLVHGDVHPGNFVVSDPANIAESLKMIDFGRSTEWLDPDTGLHMTEEVARQKEEREKTNLVNSDSNFNLAFLSYFELKLWPRSRRDDLARLAEMLCFLLDPAGSAAAYYPMGRDYPAPYEMAERKMSRQFSHLIPSKFRTFYDITFHMAFDESPDYSKFKALFVQQILL